GAAETSTIVDVWPSSSATLIVSAIPTSTFCAGILVSAKPSFVTTRSYVPGETFGNVNRPASFVVVFVVELVETSVSLMLAPGMAPPVWSVTCPTMTPVAAFCAQARAAPRLMKITMHTEKNFFEDLKLVPPCLKGEWKSPGFRSNHTGGHGKCFLKFSDCRDYPHRRGKRKALRKKRARGHPFMASQPSEFAPKPSCPRTSNGVPAG